MCINFCKLLVAYINVIFVDTYAVMFYVMQNVLYYFCLQCSMEEKKLHSNKRSVHYHVDNNCENSREARLIYGRRANDMFLFHPKTYAEDVYVKPSRRAT